MFVCFINRNGNANIGALSSTNSSAKPLHFQTSRAKICFFSIFIHLLNLFIQYRFGNVSFVCTHLSIKCLNLINFNRLHSNGQLSNLLIYLSIEYKDSEVYSSLIIIILRSLWAFWILRTNFNWTCTKCSMSHCFSSFYTNCFFLKNLN